MADVQLILRGALKGHEGWVTSVATCANFPDRLISTSRDKTTLIWGLESSGLETTGKAMKRLLGHSHFISEAALSSDSNFALTSSWDQTIRLWDLKTGLSTRRFLGHTNDVLSVAFSSDNRQIVSGSRDKTVRIWNTLGQCKWKLVDDGHVDWVSCVRITPSPGIPLVLSGGWDKKLKVWNLGSTKAHTTLEGHTNSIFCMAVSPDGSLCATGGKDNRMNLYDLFEPHLLNGIELPGEVNQLAFSPNHYWIAAAVNGSVMIYDLESKNLLCEAVPEYPAVSAKFTPPTALCLCWGSDGQTLYAGYSDGFIRVWKCSQSTYDRDRD